MAKFKFGVASKLLAVAVIVGAAGFGGNMYLDSKPLPVATTPVQMQPVEIQPVQQQEQQVAQPIQQSIAQPVQQIEQVAKPPVIQPRNDRGMDALMQSAGKK